MGMKNVERLTTRNLPLMRDNVCEVYHMARGGQLTEGQDWYPRAHAHASRLTELADIDVSQASGIIAALSPMTAWERNLTAAYAVVRGNRPVGVLGGSVRKAVAILNGGDPSEILRGNKVRAFWHLIETAGLGEAVCIDRHAFDVAVGRVTDDRQRKALERKGIYDLFASAYVKAGEVLQLPPATVQSVSWGVWRDEFAQVGSRHGQALIVA